MRRKRLDKNLELIREGVYDFYDSQEGAKEDGTIDKILNYYIDKIMKYGQDSLTKKEQEILSDAKKGRMPLDRPIYKKNKLTGDIEIDSRGNAIRVNKDMVIPGVPFITSKGRGIKKKETIDGRCYWNVDDPCRIFYVFSTANIDDENSTGLVIYKTISKSGYDLGAFIKPRSELKDRQPADVWNIINDKYDKGIVLNKEMYLLFVKFDKLYHESRKNNIEELGKIYQVLRDYPK